jgi:hypothetical protein
MIATVPFPFIFVGFYLWVCCSDMSCPVKRRAGLRHRRPKLWQLEQWPQDM